MAKPKNQPRKSNPTPAAVVAGQPLSPPPVPPSAAGSACLIDAPVETANETPATLPFLVSAGAVETPDEDDRDEPIETPAEDDAPPEDDAPAVTLPTPADPIRTVTLDVPLRRTSAYATRVLRDLSPRHARALRDLADGLNHEEIKHQGRPVTTPEHALAWLLERLAT